VLGNRPLFIDRTSRKQLTDTLRELLDVLGVELLAPFSGSLPSQFPGFRIREAFLFGFCERSFLD
jgi:hypothetical protein